MGRPTLAEQYRLARLYCPDLLDRLLALETRYRDDTAGTDAEHVRRLRDEIDRLTTRPRGPCREQ